jgi:uncharacterized protein
MRLSQFEIENINILAKKHFGQGAIVFLFGSRTNDQKRGGDIDLFIQNSNNRFLTLETKVHFLAELKTKIGERKIDVVLDNENTRQQKNFYRSVSRQKMKL